MSSSKLCFPRVRRVRLRRFSLFAANPDADFSCNLNVMCLAGANGIGKSTLLSAINFCLTGVVPDPNRTFESMDEYYKYTRDFASRYFRGRIAPTDEQDAEITLWISIGLNNYEITRGLFEPDELRGLTITKPNGEKSILTEETPRGERHQLYAGELVADSGLSSFQEFVFLQLFVFTFDEQRRTLLWHPRIIERVLFRAFGLEPGMARKADTLRREIQAEDSKVRNRQWEATRMRKRVNKIIAQASDANAARVSFDELSTEHEAFTKQYHEQTDALQLAQDSLSDTTLQLAEYSVKESALREEYDRLFNEHLGAMPSLAQHPLFVDSLSKGVCSLCGRSDARSQTIMRQRSEARTCPLCDSDIQTERTSEDTTARLRDVDTRLAKVRQTLVEVHRLLELQKTQETTIRTRWDEAKHKLNEFDQKNTATLEDLRNLVAGDGGAATLAIYREQLADIDKDKEAARIARDDKKSTLTSLQTKLEQGYAQAEQSFVQVFAELAQHFLGMPVSVRIEAHKRDAAILVLTVRDSTRRQQQQLSESQRFFIDIALRMALIQHMSDDQSPGGIFIDTPEGSLDLAYEKRAGEMLGMFAGKGHQVVMTANLNSSRLLLALANKCGRSGMELVKMTEWAELSDVQQSEEALFHEAYSNLEQALEEAG